MQNENTRNTIIFLVCMLVVFVFYQMFVLEPAQRQRNQERAAAAARAQAQNPPATPTAVTAAGAPGSLGATQTAAPSRVVTRAEAIAASGQRIEIRTPTLNGSIALRGARFDDLSLMQYRQTVDRNSAPVELLLSLIHI